MSLAKDAQGNTIAGDSTAKTPSKTIPQQEASKQPEEKPVPQGTDEQQKQEAEEQTKHLKEQIKSDAGKKALEAIREGKVC